MARLSGKWPIRGMWLAVVPLALVLVTALPAGAVERSTAVLSSAANTWTVTSTADTGGACSTLCTLRSAIAAANASTGSDAIVFNIQPAGTKTISVGAGADNGLPLISGSDITIDATTQPGGANHGIQIDDPDVGGGESGFVLDGPRITIRGFAITRFDAFGIFADPTSTGDVIAGNWIGTGDGTTAAGNGSGGIHLTGGGGTTVGGPTSADRNIVSASRNGSDGIQLQGSSNNVIVGNYVGMAADGVGRLPNADSGIELNGASQGNRIGGVTAGERNVISGNSGIGIQLLGVMNVDGTCSGPQNNVVQGNYVGLTSGGKKPSPYGNQGEGVQLSTCASNNVIGGTTAGAGNVMSSNHDDGVKINGAGGPVGAVCNNTVQGNVIGLDPTGKAQRPNVQDGIDIANGACNNLIGGTTVAARNIISANDNEGVDIVSSGANGNVVQGNYIGVGADGKTAIGNLQNGVHIRFTAQGNTVVNNVISASGFSGVKIESSSARTNIIRGNLIGTAADGSTVLGNAEYGVDVTSSASQNTIDSNSIAGSALAGVAIEQIAGTTTTQRNTITRNQIWSNGGLGIDLLPGVGVNANDGTTSSSVGNIGLDFPVIAQATANSAKGTAAAGSTVELFAARPGTGETNGEGGSYLAAARAATNGSWCVNGLTLTGGVTATATDSAGNTSEFSVNVSPSGTGDLCSTTVAPSSSAPPAISGTAVQGQTLTASTGTWSGSAPMTFGYVWRRCASDGTACADIALATSSSYTLVAADVGSTVRVAVTATNSAGSSTAVSSQTAVVTAPATSDTTAPTIGTLDAPTAVTDSGFVLSWSPATDNVGVVGYRLDVATDSGFASFAAGFQNLAVGNVTSYPLSGLARGTAYWARIRAVDAAGNVSTSSNVVSAFTNYAYDAFNRTLSGAWGSAGSLAWALAGTATDFSVNGSAGVVTESSTGSRTASLPVAQRDISVLVKFRFPVLPSAGWDGVYALARVGSSTNWYGLRVRSVAGAGDDLELNLNTSTAGTLKVGSTAGVQELVAGSWYWLRLTATGDGTTTTLSGRLWADGVSEPATWQVTGTDTTAALQAAAGAGVRVASSATAPPAQAEVDTFAASVPPGTSSQAATVVMLAAPQVYGLAESGQTLTADQGSWDGAPTAYSYQWRRCAANGSNCTDISGPQGPSYVLSSADAGSRVLVAVTASSATSSASAPSNLTSVVGTDPVIAAAGDIACDPLDPAFNGGSGTGGHCEQKATSDLLVNANLQAILALGDNQYDCGGAGAFGAAFDPSWGRAKALIHPTIGNHEYQGTSVFGSSDCTGNASAYFNYFGASAGDPTKGYYSYDIGTWHLISLNSECYAISGCGAGSPEEAWLKNDLASHPAACTLAYWHKPRFSSGNAGNNTDYQPFWADLYAAGAELVLNGHDHDYERFAPQDPSGNLDAGAGIREFVVGTGGKEHYAFKTTAANSQVGDATTFGVLKLALRPAGYDWVFAPDRSDGFRDSGSGACH
ncbi:MAG: fibronectin type III domain-containing protein [Gaiellaceae bacterium]